MVLATGPGSSHAPPDRSPTTWTLRRHARVMCRSTQSRSLHHVTEYQERKPSAMRRLLARVGKPRGAVLQAFYRSESMA
jgi:hypothetical protein